jgi:hypothetical protein
MAILSDASHPIQSEWDIPGPIQIFNAVAIQTVPFQ